MKNMDEKLDKHTDRLFKEINEKRKHDNVRGILAIICFIMLIIILSFTGYGALKSIVEFMREFK